jgi:hypothetical protein
MWAIFKLNVLLKMASGQYADDIDSFAEMYAEEYDRCIKRGGDMLYGVPVINGNTAGMAKVIKDALKKGINMGGENYNILAEIYPSAFEAYWMGAEMSPLPNFLLKPGGWPSTPPAPGTVMNIGPNPIPMAISAAIHKGIKEALQEAEEQLKSQEITIPGIAPLPSITLNVYETLEKLDKKEPLPSNIRNHPIILAAREIRNQLKQAKKKKPSIGAQIKKALKFPFPELPKRQKIIDEAKKQLIEQAVELIKQQIIIPIEEIILTPFIAPILAAIETVKNSIPKPTPTKKEVKKYVKDTIDGVTPDIDLSLYVSIPKLPTKEELKKQIDDAIPKKPELEAIAFDIIKGKIPEIPIINIVPPNILWSTKTNILLDPMLLVAKLHLFGVDGTMSVMAQYPPPAPPAPAILKWSAYIVQEGPPVPNLPATVSMPEIPEIPSIPPLPSLPELPGLPTVGLETPSLPFGIPISIPGGG